MLATIKVIVVGNGRVGKSSMTTRYCKNVYTDTYKKTIGAYSGKLAACAVLLAQIYILNRCGFYGEDD